MITHVADSGRLNLKSIMKIATAFFFAYMALSINKVSAYQGEYKTTKGLSAPGNFAASADATASMFGISSGGGLQYLSPAELAQNLDDYKALGAGWLRFDMAWSDIQSGGPSNYNWTRYDVVVDAANARGLQILAILSYTPAWARPAGSPDDDKYAPSNPQDYANFAAAAVGRYAPKGVKHWEIWNEPNIIGFWKPQPDAVKYTALLKAAYTAIKQVDPSAMVITAGMSPATNGTNIAPITFLQTLYANGAKGFFDAVGHHPYCFPIMPSEFQSWSAWSQMSQTSPSLRSVMTDNGDQNKKIWATEFGAPTNGTTPPITENQQAQMVTEAYNLIGTYAWAGPLFWYTYRDPGNDPSDREDWFGLVRLDYSRKPSYNAYQLASGVDATPPTASLTAPFNGATVAGTSVTVSANASDNVGVTGVQFKLDGNNLGAEDTTSPYAIAWNSSLISSGPHTLTAVARDAMGNTFTSTAVNVTVDNAAPRRRRPPKP